MAAKSGPRESADPDPALAAVLDRLYNYYPKGIDLSLERVLRFLERLGNPHLHLPPVVHVAGTNGKGSTVAMLRAMLEAASFRVHAFTSPHLVHFRERIRLAGTLIDDALLLEILAECERVNGDAPITFFEMTTAAAFLAFSRVPADFCILETGMGGLLDATNVVPRPLASVIMTISYDHRDYLGDTLRAIATEKAGIMKPGVPCIIGYQTAEAVAGGVMDVFERRAADLRAPLLRGGHEWSAGALDGGQGFAFRAQGCAGEGERFPAPSLIGEHQIRNAGAALAALELIGDPRLNAQAKAKGLLNIDWPARLQPIRSGPLAALLPEGWELWLDGGHNDSAGQILADQARCWAAQDGKPLHVVAGMLKTKSPAEFLSPLLAHADSFTAIAIPDEKLSLSAEDMANVATGLGLCPVLTAESPAAAIAGLVKTALETPSRVLICGSLYLAGKVLASGESNL